MKKLSLGAFILLGLGSLAFVAGLFWAREAAAEPQSGRAQKPKIVYPDRTNLEFEGTSIEGEVKNPAEFYFQRRQEEKFDSLVKRRKNFHKEMLRDVVLSR